MKFIPLFLVLSLASSSFASAGTVGGGGGQGIVCTDKQTGKRTVTLLDLWEGKAMGTSWEEPTKDLAATVDDALVRIAPGFAANLFSRDCKDNCFLEALREQAAKFLDGKDGKLLRRHGETIALTADTYTVAWPVDCPPQQIVNYQPNGFIWRNEDLFEDMDTLNQAALIVHESLYAVLRQWGGDTNSIRTRRAVAYVFSGGAFADNHPNLPHELVHCGNKNPMDAYTAIDIFKDPKQDHLDMYVSRINGQEPLGRTNWTWDFGFKAKDLAPLVNGKCPADIAIASGIDVDGPVEYDRNTTFTRVCANGKATFYLSGTYPGTNDSYQIPLVCTYGVFKHVY